MASSNVKISQKHKLDGFKNELFREHNIPVNFQNYGKKVAAVISELLDSNVYIYGIKNSEIGHYECEPSRVLKCFMSTCSTIGYKFKILQ